MVWTYWRAARPYSLTASLVPVLLGTALAKLLLPDTLLDRAFWLQSLLVLIGCLCAQMISNLVNDLVEFKSGFDAHDKAKRYNALAAGDLTPRQMLRFVELLGAVGALIGLYFVWLVPGPLLVIVVAGGILAIEYTAPPLKLKYRALGDFAVLLCFGLGMLFGAYLVAAHHDPHGLTAPNLLVVLLYGLPNAALVVAILHANNHRDRESDVAIGAHTVANSLSFAASKRLLVGLLVGPYIYVTIGAFSGAAFFGWANLFCLSVLVSAPKLVQLLRPIREDRYQTTVPGVAKLHGLFGLLLTLAVVLQVSINHAH
jgi:1,4-dihydroxy-2-naphthoate octaprenyltransferase